MSLDWSAVDWKCYWNIPLTQYAIFADAMQFLSRSSRCLVVGAGRAPFKTCFDQRKDDGRVRDQIKSPINCQCVNITYTLKYDCTCLILTFCQIRFSGSKIRSETLSRCGWTSKGCLPGPAGLLTANLLAPMADSEDN